MAIFVWMELLNQFSVELSEFVCWHLFHALDYEIFWCTREFVDQVDLINFSLWMLSFGWLLLVILFC